jgi:hypothetical protein
MDLDLYIAKVEAELHSYAEDFILVWFLEDITDSWVERNTVQCCVDNILTNNGITWAEPDVRGA